MSGYFVKAILLDGCPYSQSAHQLLKIHNIPSKIITVNQDNKAIYKTENINTFPQIYLNKYNSKGSLLLGGNDELSDFITNFKGHKYSEENVEKYMRKHNWSKKAILRLIQLINVK